MTKRLTQQQEKEIQDLADKFDNMLYELDDLYSEEGISEEEYNEKYSEIRQQQDFELNQLRAKFIRENS